MRKKWGVDPKRKTPAYEQRDGVDYEPAPKSVVFGDVLQFVFATLIIILGVCVVIEGFRKLFAKETESK